MFDFWFKSNYAKTSKSTSKGLPTTSAAKEQFLEFLWIFLEKKIFFESSTFYSKSNFGFDQMFKIDY
jgi:hypothetical protein